MSLEHCSRTLNCKTAHDYEACHRQGLPELNSYTDVADIAIGPMQPSLEHTYAASVAHQVTGPFGPHTQGASAGNVARPRLLPALPLTLAELELLLQERVVDLAAVAEVAKRDASFTAQLLLFANQDLDECDRLYRVEDCLVQLGISTVQELVSETPPLVPSEWRTATLLDHSRQTAIAAESIAHQVPGMDPEKAYLAGLLHLFPELVWLRTGASGDESDEWPLPAFVWEATCWSGHPFLVAKGENLLGEVVRLACEWVGRAALERYRSRRSG